MKTRRINKAKFLGKDFRIICQCAPKGAPKNALGGTTSRRAKNRGIFLDPRLRGMNLFETAIHEALHACFDAKLGEKAVEQAGADITKFVQRIGLDPRWMDAEDIEMLEAQS